MADSQTFADKVPAISPTGKRVFVPVEYWRSGRPEQLGFRLRDPEEERKRVLKEEFTTPEAKLLATTAGVFRGGTLGLSDVGFKSAGIDKETLSKLKEYNPKLSVAGEVGGAVLPLLFTGGGSAAASAAAKGGAGAARAIGPATRAVSAAGTQISKKLTSALGAKTAKTVSGRVAAETIAKGAAGMAEGALYGAGQLVSEAAIGDSDLTADKIAGHVGMGALIGGGAGALLSGGAAAAKEVTSTAKEIIRKSLVKAAGRSDDVMAGLAESQAVRSLNGTQTQIQKLQNRRSLRGRGSMYDDVAEDLMFPQSSLSGEAVVDKLGDLKKTSKNIDTVRKAAVESKKTTLKELSDAAEELGDGVSGSVIAQRIRTSVLDGIEDIPGFKAERNVTKKLIKEWEELGDAKLSLQKADQIKIKLQKRAEKSYGKLTGKTFSDELKEKAAAAVNAELDKVAKRAAEGTGKPEVFTNFIKSKRLIGTMSEADKLAKKGLARWSGNRAVSLTDYLSGGSVGILAGATGGLGAGAVAGLAAPIANRLFRTRGNAVAAHMLAKGRRLAVIQNAASASERRISAAISKIATTGKEAGRKAAVLTEGAGKGAADAAIKEESLERIRKFAAPSAVNILNRFSLGAFGNGSSGEDSYRVRLKELSDAVSSPERMQVIASRSIDGIADLAPQMAQGIANQVSRALQFAYDKAPKPPAYTDTLTPFNGAGWEPPKTEMLKWSRYLQALDDPIGVVEQISTGMITSEGVETLKSVYPSLYSYVMNSLVGQYDRITKGISKQGGIGLSTFFGIPYDATMRPSFIRNVQSSYGYEPESPSEDVGGAVNPTATGLKNLDSADRAQTGIEKLLSR